RAATAALASPGPIDSATCIALLSSGTSRLEPSGNLTTAIETSRSNDKTKPPGFHRAGLSHLANNDATSPPAIHGRRGRRRVDQHPRHHSKYISVGFGGQSIVAWASRPSKLLTAGSRARRPSHVVITLRSSRGIHPCNS